MIVGKAENYERMYVHLGANFTTKIDIKKIIILIVDYKYLNLILINML